MTTLASASGGDLSVPVAILLGLVEGLTEFLPISSTGHLTVVQRLLGLDGAAADAYAVVVQAGAIAAVVALYRSRLAAMARGVTGRSAEGRALLVALLVAFLPAGVAGLAMGDAIQERLFGVGPVAAAWLAGGLAILAVGRRADTGRGRPLDTIDVRTALLIGVAQTLALWPGVSRSLVTLLAALALGLSLGAAVEFSFLLGLVTLGAAAIYELASSGQEIASAFGVATPLLGFAVAFASAAGSIRWMVRYLQGHDLAVFGYYRLAAGSAALALLATGVV